MSKRHEFTTKAGLRVAEAAAVLKTNEVHFMTWMRLTCRDHCSGSDPLSRWVQWAVSHLRENPGAGHVSWLLGRVATDACRELFTMRQHARELSHSLWGLFDTADAHPYDAPKLDE